MTETAQPVNESTLCLACGLCCDGSLFYHAGLQPHELENARTLNLTVRETGSNPAFYLPCHLLQNGSCSIYGKPERPQVCGGFRCKLLKRHASGKVDLETAINIVQQTRSLLAKVQEQMPYDNTRPVTFNSIRLMLFYVSALPEQDRQAHASFLKTALKYMNFIRRNFVSLKNKQPAPAHHIPLSNGASFNA